MKPLTKRHITVVALLALVFAFAAYHDKPSDTQELTDMQADLTDAQVDALVAWLARK